MTPLSDFDGLLVRDKLTKGEVHWVKDQRDNGKVQLIELNDSNGSFAGYFPMNANLKEGLSVVRLPDGTLSTCPIVVGG